MIKKPDPRLLDTHQAANYLSLSAGTLKQWRHSGAVKLRFVRIGGAVRYRPADLERFIEEHLETGVAQ